MEYKLNVSHESITLDVTDELIHSITGCVFLTHRGELQSVRNLVDLWRLLASIMKVLFFKLLRINGRFVSPYLDSIQK